MILSFCGQKKDKLNYCNNMVLNMATFSYKLRTSAVILPTSACYREQMIVKRDTMLTHHENYLPSIFDA